MTVLFYYTLLFSSFEMFISADTTSMVKHIFFKELNITFLIGAIAYPCLEIAFRGHTHWTMSLAGGLCFALLYAFQAAMPDLPFWQKAVAGTVIITTVELAIGTVVNLWLHWTVWDYSDLHFHYLGQISLAFVFIWYFLSSLFFGVAGSVRRICTK